MNEAWVALTRYKMLEEQVKDLRTRAWISLVPSDDVETALVEAERDLEQLKAWIKVNFKTTKAD